MTRRLLLVPVVAYAVVWTWALLVLPERVPLHFGPGGQADRFAGRTEALVSFAVLGVAVSALLLWSDRLTERGSLRWLNVPHRDWWTATPERQRRVRQLLRADTALVSAATMALLVVALAATVLAAGRAEPRLGWVFFAALGLYLVLVLAWVVRMYGGRYRPDRQEDLQ